jgi:hypothetical protein
MMLLGFAGLALAGYRRGAVHGLIRQSVDPSRWRRAERPAYVAPEAQ